MGDLTGKFAGKPKARGSRFGPATNRWFAWRSVKCRIHFDGGEPPRIKFKPVRLWQIGWIKDTTPVAKAPCARANAYFLLVEQIQMDRKAIRFCRSEKMSDWGTRLCQKFDGLDKLTTLPHLDATSHSRVRIIRRHAAPFT